MSDNNNINNNNNTAPVNPQKLEQDYTYPIEETEEQEQQQPQQQEPPAEASLYTKEIKDLAQSKVFTIHFIDGSKKIYMRRKPSLGEVGNYEEAKQHMFQFKGSPKQMRKAITDFYTYAASIHLRETKTAGTITEGKMTAEEVQKTVFEDFKKVIDACEYAMLFNPNSQSV